MSNHFQYQYNEADNSDDLLLSQFSHESLFKSQESLQQNKKRKSQQAQQTQQNYVIQEEISNTLIMQKDQHSFQKNQQESKEVQLLQLVSHLRFLLQQQQQDFYEKELYLQQKLLTSQQQHDSLISLMKTKYQIIIQELQQKLSIQQIENANMKQTIFQLQEQLQKYTQGKNQLNIIERNKDENHLFTERKTYSNQKLNDYCQIQHDQDKLLLLYQQEIEKVKQQTAEFDRKVENEKQLIKQEISALKNQKITLISNRQVTNSSTDKQYTQTMNSDHKTNDTKRDSQYRAYSRISRKSLNF